VIEGEVEVQLALQGVECALILGIGRVGIGQQGAGQLGRDIEILRCLRAVVGQPKTISTRMMVT